MVVGAVVGSLNRHALTNGIEEGCISTRGIRLMIPWGRLQK